MKKLIDTLVFIQQGLKAPKGNYNSFGKYNYRSCEDILEAVKPLLAERGVALKIYDAVEECGGRIYIKATAVLTDGENSIDTTAYAREAETKKGMDESQVTGTASSYARKYALNGLFCIDDAKDADTDEYRRTGEYSPRSAKKAHESGETEYAGQTIISAQDARNMRDYATKAGRDIKAMCEYFGIASVEEMTVKQYAEAFKILSKPQTNNRKEINA